MNYDDAQIAQLATSLSPRYSLIRVALSSQPVAQWTRQLKDFVLAISQKESDGEHTPAAIIRPGEQNGITRSVDYEPGSNRFIIKFPYDPMENMRVMDFVPGVHFIKTIQGWVVPASLINAEAIKHFTEDRAYTFTPPCQSHLIEMFKTAKELKQASHRFDGSTRQLGNILLRPFQVCGVEYAQRVERALIADQPGVGKTFQGLGFLDAVNGFPGLIVPPASYKYGWLDEIKRALPNRTTLVCNSQSHLQMSSLWQTYDLYVINYDLLSGGYTDDTKKVLVLSDVAQAIKDRGIKAIVCDEAHYIANEHAQRSQAVFMMAEGVKWRLALTGTPGERPVKLVGILQFLDRIKDFGNKTKFKQRYCGLKQIRTNTKKGTAWTANEGHNLPELNELMRSTFMILRRKKDVLDELPDLTRTLIRVDLSNRREYEEAEYDIVAYIRRIAYEDQKFRESLPTDWTPEQREIAIREYANDKERKAKRAQVIIKLNALRRLCAKGKLSSSQDWITSFREGEQKLVVFAFFRESQEELLKFCPTAERVFGTDSALTRNSAVKRFQELDAAREIICSISAAAEAITLTAASDVLVTELPWGADKDDQIVGRCHRSGQKNCVNAYYIVGNDSVDIDTYDLIQEKRQMRDAMLGADVDESEESFVDALMDKILARYTGR